MNLSKLKDGFVALWPPVKLGQIYAYFSEITGQFTTEKMKFLQEFRCLYIIFTARFPDVCYTSSEWWNGIVVIVRNELIIVE